MRNSKTVAVERKTSAMERFARRIDERLDDDFFVRALVGLAVGLISALPYLIVGLIQAIIVPHRIGLPMWPAYVIAGVVFVISTIVLNGSFLKHKFCKKSRTAKVSDSE